MSTPPKKSFKILKEDKTKSRLELNPLPEISITAYLLGIVAGSSLTLIFTQTFQNFKSLPIYIFSISLFHFLEYFITATYQPLRVESTSFVLDNAAYQVAHAVAIFEVLLELWLFPSFKTNPMYNSIKLLGLFLVILGQYTRTLAMKTAGSNFSHLIKDEKEDDHILIKHGIYAYLRHPSYFGFFYWALGTQLLLLNPVSAILFTYLLHGFFQPRIRFEEIHLVRFFGDEYINYRNSTYIGIPFIQNKSVKK